MNPSDLADRINAITDRAQEYLEGAVTKTQQELFDSLQATLSGLDLDQNGLIRQSAANRKILQKAERIFDESVKGSGYYESLYQYAGALDSIAGVNEKYFSSIIENFTVDAHYLKSLQKTSISTIESMLANEGLESQLKQPLMQILNENINSGAGFSDMLRQVREFIVGGPDREGRLMRYSKQISRDTLFNFSSSMQESISQNAGMEWYVYSGSARKDSREFCAKRSGQYFHRKEIEGWASLSWAGKRAGTTKSTIYIYRGGYNCEHSMIPVSELVVPKDVIERNS